MGGLASAAWKRPWALLGAAVVLLAVLGAIALGAVGSLGHGPETAGERERPELVVVAAAPPGTGAPAYEVAVAAIVAGLRADPTVGDVRVSEPAGEARVAAMSVSAASGDAGARHELAASLAERIDPGPLALTVGGRTAELREAQSLALDDLWLPLLLALPLCWAALAAVVGPRLAAGPALCAAIAVAGALAGMRIAGAVADPSLLALVPAAVVGLALGIELPALLVARWEDAVGLNEPQAALHSTLTEGAGPIVFAAAAGALAPAGLLATGYGPAVAIALGCALAAAGAAGASLLVMPPVLALSERLGRERRDAPGDRRLAHALGAPARALARGGRRTLAAALGALAVSLAIASPALDGATRTLGTADLPAGSPPVRAAELAPDAIDAATTSTLMERLPLAAALCAGLVGLCLIARSRSARTLPFGVLPLLPAAAACGLAVVVLDPEGWFSRLSVAGLGAVPAGAAAAGVSALVAIGSARVAATLDASRSERELDPGAPGVAERAGGLTLPAALASTVVCGAALVATGTIALDAARALAVMGAGGLLLDLILMRSPALAAAARWQAAGGVRGDRARRLRLGWPRWRRRASEAGERTASAS